jgi:hypothetical protein
MEETPRSEDELREEDVTREDNLDDNAEEGEQLPRSLGHTPAGPAGTAEGEDASTGAAPASSAPGDGQDDEKPEQEG